jgi:DNA-3-methyladenine glycosylase
VVLRVTEVEAYAGVGEDPGSHAHKGRRPRNATMFGRPGLLYVYFTYGMHWCANVVAHPVADGAAGAVLLRAGEVLVGAELATARRPAAGREADLARGPARLTKALAVTGEDDGADLLDPASRIRLLPAEVPPEEVLCGPRVGVAGPGAPTPWRWWDARSGTVSAYRAAQPRTRSPQRATGTPAPGGAP